MANYNDWPRWLELKSPTWCLQLGKGILSWSPLTYYLYYLPLKWLGFLFEMLRHCVHYSDGCPLAPKSEDTHQTNKCQSPYIKNRLYKCKKSQLGLVHINWYLPTASKISCTSATNLCIGLGHINSGHQQTASFKVWVLSKWVEN